MWELIIGLFVGEFLGARWGWQPKESLMLGVGLAVAAYFFSCAWFPYRRCPWPWCPKFRKTAGDKRGHYRRRRPCPVCKNEDWPRVGARLLGRV